MIIIKNREYKEMERFVAYKGSDNIIIHFLCEEQSAKHYHVLPYFKSIAEYCIYDRILFLMKTFFVSIIVAFIILIFSIITKSWIFVFLVTSITIMWCYVLLQLFLDDIDGIKVYELCFDNSSFCLLSNMDVNNKTNKMIELYKKRQISIESGVLPIVYIKATFRYLIMEYSRKSILIKYLLSTKEALNLDSVKNDDLKVRLYNEINSVRLEIYELGYKVIDIYSVNI